MFVGTAGAPVKGWVQLPDQPLVEMVLTPVAVERAYVGVSTPVVYLTPLGIEEYATPGRRYLVYGSGYRPPDIVMASPGFGAKPIERAGQDLAFLDQLIPGLRGGTIAGIVQEKAYVHGKVPSPIIRPLDGILVRIFSEKYSTETVTGIDGRFVVTGLPAGVYEFAPQLPDDLVTWDSTSRSTRAIRDSGCALVTIDTVFSGRVRGVLRGPDSQPLPRTSVDLVPIDVKPDPVTGHVIGAGSVSTNLRGEFEFKGRPPGRYWLGLSLYNAPNRYGPSFPRTYYPGTTDREHAVPVVVEGAANGNAFDFTLPEAFSKGELTVVVETSYQGKLTVCFVQLEDLFLSWSSEDVAAGVPITRPVVDGQRYQVHAHLEYPGGHLESEPVVFTATTQRTVVTLRPNAPRTFHR